MTSQLAGRTGNRRMTAPRREVSAPGGAGKGVTVFSSASETPSLSLLYKKAVGHLPRGLSFPQSTLYLFLFSSSYLTPLSPPLLFQYAVSTGSPSSPALSASVKSDGLQVCLHGEGGFTAAREPETSRHDTAPFPLIYWAVIYPQDPYTYLNCIYACRSVWLSYLS